MEGINKIKSPKGVKNVFMVILFYLKYYIYKNTDFNSNVLYCVFLVKYYLFKKYKAA